MTATETAPARHSAPMEGQAPKRVPPTDTQIARFDGSDRALLARLLSEPTDYVDHELFAKPRAEEILFGRQAVRGPRSSRLAEADRPEPPRETLDETGTLTSAQEILLFQRFNYARMRVSQLFEAHAGKRMPARVLRELLAWARRAMAARSRITQANVALVLAMAKRTRLSGLDFNELVSEGNFALLRSVDKFDCSRGFKFSTYACRAILKSFSRVAMRASRYRGRFPMEFDPSLEKSDFVERRRDDVESDCVAEVREILAQNRADLNDMERVVIRERFALERTADASKPKTLEQVGEMIGVTKERVRQIQNKALRKIRLILEENFLAA